MRVIHADAAKYRARHPVCATSNLSTAKSSAVASIYIQAWIFNRTYLRCYSRYVYNSERVILHICCQIRGTTSGLRYVNSGLGQYQRIFSFAYSSMNVHLNITTLLLVMSTIQCAIYFSYPAKYRARHPVCATSTLVKVKTSVFPLLHIRAWIFIWTYLRCYWWYVDNLMRFMLSICYQIQSTTSDLGYVKSGLGQEQRISTFAYSSMNIHLNISPLLFLICR